MVDITTTSEYINQSKNDKLLSELHYALKHKEKLEYLPEKVETNIFYRLSLTLKTKDIYKCDSYSWKNSKKIAYPKAKPEFEKIYYISINADKKLDNRCTKAVYISLVNELDVLVIYSGNLSIATKHPHGNCKRYNSHMFHYTNAATIQEIDRLVTNMSGSAAYKKLVATNGQLNAPRNVAQCQYRRQKVLQERKITEDELKNVILLSYELTSFYKLLQIQPELIIVLMHDEMKIQFSKLIKASKEKIVLFYDTTFSLGEIYVSILSYRHVMFSERPIIPLAILMHDTKRQHAHENFVQSLTKALPDLHDKCILVTDGEYALKNAFNKNYPSVLQLLCWNHVFKNIKRHAKQWFRRETTSNDIQEQINNTEQYHDDDDDKNDHETIASTIDMIKNMLRAESRDDFLLQYQQISQSWPAKFRVYFEEQHLSSIDEIGGWTSRPLGLFDEYSGVTNNASESINAVIKRWTAWKELSLDVLVQMFHLVLGFYVNEIRRGFCAYGGYHLEIVYSNLKIDQAYLTTLPGFSPDEAVQRIKSIMLEKKQKSNSNTNLDSSGLENQLTSSDLININNKNEKVVQSSVETQTASVYETSADSSSNDQRPIQQETLTNSTRANLVLEEGLVSYDVTAKTFNVRSLDRQTVHSVHMGDRKRLFKCSCPSSLQTCAHILPVKLFLGMPVDDQDNSINLGHARKRRRVEDKIRKPGGKRPRRCDKDPKQTHTSPYFLSNQSNAANLPHNSQNNVASQMITGIGSSSITPTFTNLNNSSSISSPITSAVCGTSNVAKTIRILTPLNINIPVSQQQRQQPNQYVILKSTQGP